MSRYTCRRCGKAKDSKEEDYDYYLDGVACETCLKEIETEDLEKNDERY